MKISILFFFAFLGAFVISSCDDDYIPNCGFSDGPFLAFQNKSPESIVVQYYNSEGIGDSVVCIPRSYNKVPIDAHSPAMYFLVRSRAGVDSLSISYSVKVEKERNRMKLFLDNINGEIQSGQIIHNMLIPIESYRQDTLSHSSIKNWQINGCSRALLVI